MIEFEVLAIKADTNNLHAIFLLKKNIQYDIIKTILGYLPIVAPDILKEWKVAITSVGQEYESTEECHDYKTEIEMTYGEWGQPIDIGKSNKNFKDRKPKYFNYNKYGYMAKKCQLKKKEYDTRKCFKCNKEGYIAKDCKRTQLMKKWQVQEGSDDKDKDKEQSFGEDFK